MRQGRGSGEKDRSVSVSSADVALEEKLRPASDFIDTYADTQNEPAALAIDAGVSDLKVLYHDGKVALPVHLTIQTSTGLHRGVHMSRLVHAASSHDSPDIGVVARSDMQGGEQDPAGVVGHVHVRAPVRRPVHPRLDQDEPDGRRQIPVHREGDDRLPLQQEDDRHRPHAEGRDRDDGPGAQARRHAQVDREDGGVLLRRADREDEEGRGGEEDPRGPGATRGSPRTWCGSARGASRTRSTYAPGASSRYTPTTRLPPGRRRPGWVPEF